MSLGSSHFRYLLLASLLAACASGPQAPSQLRSQSGVRPADGAKDLPAAEPDTKPAEPAAAPTAEPPVAEDNAGASKNDPTVIVIEEAAQPRAVTPRDLVEASRLERERRERAGKPTVVITDKNLAQHARNGRVTTGSAAPPSSAGASVAAAPADLEGSWRGRMRSLRQAWRDAVDRLPKLEKEAADQRIRFYAEDDPYVRDGRIKPAWDRALEVLEKARADAEQAKAAIATALDEGKRTGAEPAWLLEGLELEPLEKTERLTGAPSEPRNGAEPREPNVIEEPPR